MSKFQFRLARLAHVRALQERVARERWLAAEELTRAAEAKAESARETVLRARDELRAEQSAPTIAIERVMAGARLVETLRERRRSAVEHARTLRFQAEELRRPWSERRREVRGLERLESRDQEQHRQEELVREARELDEVASMRASARTRQRAGADARVAAQGTEPTLGALSPWTDRDDTGAHDIDKIRA
jgi:flagellar export protein FliJ